MGPWDALYYVVTPGQSSASDQTRFKKVYYQNTTWDPDSNWILICVRNGDNNELKWLPGQTTLGLGQSYNSTNRGTYGAVFADSAANQSGGTVSCTSGTFSGTFSASTASSRDKFRVYPSPQYCIGMQSAVTYGDLNDWAMTFQMYNEDDRGFWWGDDGHGVNQGAMALSTRGWLNVAERIKVGGGQTDTAAASYALHVVGDIYATGNVTAYSDIRKKKNLQIIETPIEKVKKINGYTYEIDERRYTGLVAQEVLKVLPEAVIGDEEKGYGLAYGNIAGLFVEALKEMKSQLDSALARLDALENTPN